MNTVDVLGLPFVNEGIIETVEAAMVLMERRESAYAVAPDTELLQAARKSSRLMRAVKGAELILPEGNGVIYASHILGLPLSGRICAVDFISALMARMSEKGMSVFVLGDEPELVERAEEKISLRYPGIRLAGSENDYYSSEIERINAINETKPDLLLVGLGSPKQEIWMSRNREDVDAGLMVGCGEGLRVLAEMKQRAPKRWRDSGFEWLYWLIKEPKRIPRMLRRGGLVLTALWRRLVG